MPSPNVETVLFLHHSKMAGRKPKQIRRSLTINRAPVLTLWEAVVAERLGFNRKEALTLGRAVAGLNAYSKGVRRGLFQPAPREVREMDAKQAFVAGRKRI